mmetsp:Transcript_30920/g.69463  ORF Transcript_30920/g.69463 Transcript_30920/m.69463 type:complete len:145 (-) Transcript_30920:319-753(-)
MAGLARYMALAVRAQSRVHFPCSSSAVSCQLVTRRAPPIFSTPRYLSSQHGLDPKLKARMDALADMFVEARDEIEMAEESKGTTYFNEEATVAEEAVTAAIKEYRTIRDSLDEPARGEFERGNGLKMEQLKAELELLLESDHDH